ncbi:hypothetical protein STENM327S_03352 [Streptomyces tendae]
MNVRPIAGAVLGLLMLTVTACGGGGSGSGAGDGKGEKGKDSTAAQSEQSEAVVTIAPANGAKSVDTSGALKVGAAKGKLTEVVVKDGKGAKVDGKISGDGATWTPSTHLAAATTYSVHAVAKDSEGRTAAEDSRFTTLTPKNTFVGSFTPEDGSKVGVGMPFSIRFTRGITNPEDVEKAITVKTEPAVEVEGHWFGNDRLDFRPEKYWKAGTKVTVDLNLDGVEGREDVYGKQAKTVSFTVGRSQVSVVDAKKHTMKVMRDGKTIKTIPVTTGAPGYETWNGQMVDHRAARGDPDERRDRRLRRRVRHQGRPARHAPVHLRHLHPRQLLGRRRLRQQQRQPRLHRPARRARRLGREGAGPLVLRELDRR